MSFDDDLNSVPWDRLHHAYGPATDVPDLLAALMNPDLATPKLIDAARQNDRTMFDHVTWELWGNVFHQGSVWQVTSRTVPLFETILRNGPDDAETHGFLITYLHHLALGYPDDRFPEPPRPDDDFAEVSGLQDTDDEPDYAANDTRPPIWMRDTYEAVERCLPTVLSHLEAPNDNVADAAIAFCTAFPRRSEHALPPLRLIAETDTPRGAKATLSLAALGAPDAATLAEGHMTSPDPTTSIYGACASILATGAPADTAVAILTAPLDTIGDTPCAHAGTLSTLVGRCLERLPPAHNNQVIESLSAQLAKASPMEAISLTQNLLSTAFPDAIPDKASQLTPSQRRALNAICEHGPFTVNGATFANFTFVLRDRGLPDTKKALRKWLKPRWLF